MSETIFDAINLINFDDNDSMDWLMMYINMEFDIHRLIYLELSNE